MARQVKKSTDKSNPTKYSLEGTIYGAHNNPLPKVMVKAYDKDLRTEQLLGEALTNTSGHYTINYTSLQISRAEIKSPDVFIRVFQKSGNKLKEMGTSDLYFNVSLEFTLNFKIDGSTYQGLSEFERLINAIEPLLIDQKVNFEDLVENEEHQDIGFLSAETGEDAGKIAFLPMAFQHAGKTKMPADLFYGLFRMQFPTTLNSLTLVKSASLARGINEAIDLNIISSKWKSKIPGFTKKMDQLSTDIILKEAEEGKFSIKNMIGTTLPDKKLQKIFIDTYLAFEDEPEKFWDKLASQDDFKDGKAIRETQNILRLNLMTAQPELADRLYKLQEQDPDLKEFSGYARLTKKDFSGHIKTLVSAGKIKEFPEGIEGNTSEEKIEHYASTLEELVTELFPVEAFKNRLAADNNHPFGENKADLTSFFAKNPDFDLKTSKINTALEESDFNGIRNPEATKKELKTINRIYKLTPSYSDTSFLLNNDLDSATAIVQNLSKNQFIQKAEGKIDKNRSIRIYQKALQIDKYSTAIAMDLRMRNDISIYAIQGSTKVSPDYQSLFGDNYLCECDHCQSVYSPSAYLTDILNLISKKQPGAYTLLTENRRSDIPDILLNCKNTNTPLPYLDLVNELLEGFLSPEGIVAHQTNNTTAELAAYPEHTNHEVYENKLSSNFDSYQLPLNLPLEETRMYLDKLGCKRFELMELFYGKKGEDKYQDLTIAAEYLHLSKQELEFINKTIPVQPVNIEKVDAFLVYTGLTYIELLQLLECFYINPIKADGNRTIEIVADEMDEEGHTIDPTTCNIAYLKLKGLTSDVSEKIVRFIRLWKKLKWEVFDLDRALLALDVDISTASSTDINEKIMIPLSHTARLQDLFGLDINSILSFWSLIDTATFRDQSQNEETELPSQYEKLFQNKQISNPLDPDFEDPTNISGSLTEKSSLIKAAFNLAESDYNLLLQSVIPNDDLTLENLSILYGHVLLARKLKLTIQSLLLFIELTGIAPFGHPDNTSRTFNFIERVQLIKLYGFTFAELNHYLKGISVNSTPPDQNKTIAELTVIREGLLKLEPLFPGADVDADVKENKRRVQIDFMANVLSPVFNLSSEIINIMLDGMVTFKKGNDDIEEVVVPLTDPSFILSKGPVVLPDDEDPPDIFRAYVALSDTSERLEGLRDKLSISPGEFVYFQQHQTALELEGFWNLPENGAGAEMFDKLENLLFLLKFRDNLDHPPNDWFTLLDFPIFNEVDAKTNFIDGLIELSETSKDDLEYLLDPANTDSLNFTFPTDFLSGQNLLNLLDCLYKIEDWGSTAQVLAQLTKQDIKDEEAKLAQGILKTKYDENGWLEIIKPISNVLRGMKRRGLVSYILSSEETRDFRTNHNILDTNGLFEYFLIDTEMSSCMLTSRIKQAISSIQLFVDRCFLGLEEGANLGSEFFHQWNDWRKIYRIWEANRKVFLYPENWILPELREDKSPFFLELESSLNQNDISTETAKEALLGYLEKLDTVANLEVIGVFPDELTEIVHVIARTRNKPHQYFYRKQYKAIWSAWELLELDIEGDHILPVVWNNRLMLFWALFEEKQEKEKGGLKIPPLANGGTIPEKANYYDIKIQWSEYKKGKWGPTQVSSHAVSTPVNIFPPATISLGSLIVQDKLFIRIYMTLFPNPEILASLLLVDREILFPGNNSMVDKVPFLNEITFRLSGCQNKLEINRAKNFNGQILYPNLQTPKGVLSRSMHIDETTNESLKLFQSGWYYTGNDNKLITLLNKTPGKYQILPNHHETENKKPVHFFYNNGENNYYARSIEAFRPTIPIDDLVVSTGTLIAREDLGPVIGNPPSPVIEETRSNTLTSIGLSNAFFADKIKFPGKRIFFKRRYLFQTFYHPFVCNYIKILNAEGIDGLYEEQVQKTNTTPTFKSLYDPTLNIARPYPEEELDFSFFGTYSLYNWELFFHIPLLMATKLSQNQKFEEARKWFHYIFDPTKSSESADPGVKRFWITRPLKKEIEDGILSVEELLNDADNQANLNVQLKYWENNPFNPHGIARRRISAYMRTTLMKYIDNLIAWGDQLFLRDSIESINEATLLYIMAANLLGKKPENIPMRARPQEQSFNTLQNSGLDNFGNAKVAIQSFISPSALNGEDTSDENVLMPLFCTPKNNKLLGYWDTVADRLFKIRNCMNIQGVVRQLPLFEPPIDPALLVRATAQGIDLTNVLNDVEAPLPHYRFQVMLQKSRELANDVKTLGSQLLSALEKRDAEELTLLRSGQEIKLLDLIRDVRIKQRNEAKESLKALQFSRNQVDEKYNYFNDKEYLNESEILYFDLTQSGLAIQSTLHLNYALASLRHLIPDVKIGSGFTLGTTYGGINLGNAAMTALEGGQALSNFLKSSGEMANMIGGFERRQEEWDFQANQASLELKQIDKQLIASEIRLAIAENELANHDQQIDNAEETDAFMHDKFTNKQLYDWMIGQISSVYFTSYQLAHDYARKAEKCYRYELGNDDSFVSYGYWDSLKQGLQCADHLINDLNRMETRYLDKNEREYELIKHVSLSKLDPLALVLLKETGTCSFEVPEVLYDLDHAGHYFRRIKSVSISLPCIVGPYTSVSARLTLESNKYRNNPSVGSGYVEDLNDINNPDPRFTRNIGTIKSLSTSTGQNDSGVFELNFRDERYLPFEGCGAISAWKLQLPNDARQFDYNTISDVILHVKYTAKESSELKTPAVNSLIGQLEQIKQQLEKTGLHLALNLKHDLSNEWHLLKQKGVVNLKIDASRLPYMAQTSEATIEEVLFIAGIKDNPPTFPITIDGSLTEMEKINDDLNLLQATRDDIELDEPFEIVVEESDLNKLESLMLFVKYGF